MIKQVLLTSLLISITQTACTAGCLRCDSTNQCLLPNLFEFFIIKKGKPEKVVIEHCLAIDLVGNCLGCAEGFYIEATTNSCVAVTKSTEIQDCRLYQNGTTCIECKPGYYLSSNACSIVSPPINKCKVHKSAKECLECESGFLLSSNGGGVFRTLTEIIVLHMRL